MHDSRCLCRLNMHALRDRGKSPRMLSQMLVFSLLFLSMPSQWMVLATTSVPVPTTTVEISPVNNEIQREGDTVSLLCRVDYFDTERYILSWNINQTGRFGTVSSANTPETHWGYSYKFEKSDPFPSSFVFNLTINQVMHSDSGTFQCNLIERLSNNSSKGLAQLELVLRVYPFDAFPICIPVGGSSLVVGSQLACQANGATSLKINGSNEAWISLMLQEENGTLLYKNVTFADNGMTFVCVAVTPDYQRNLSCNIGPLTVVTSVFSLTTDETITNSGLTPADISGIAVGAVALIILIAIHALCCHCDPRKCMNAKSYILDLGSSLGTWNQRADSTRRQSEVEMSGSTPEASDIPQTHKSAFDEELGESQPRNFDETSQPALTSELKALYAEPTFVVKKSAPNIEPSLYKNITTADVTATSGAVVPTLLAHHEPRVEIANEIPRATVGSSYDSPPNLALLTETVPANPDGKPLPDQQIYAKVDKPKRRVESANSDATSNTTTGVVEKPKVQEKPKNIEKSGVNAGHKVDAVPKTVIYADLNLNGAGEGQSINISEELPTVYTEIQHQL